MNHFTLPVTRTAHYYTLGNINKEIKDLWIVCHGYGHSADGFLKDFEGIEQEDRLVVAPEGLSKFYWGGFSGPPASSWMTSKDRLSEIEDFCNWLDDLYALIVPQLHSEVKITLLGFSQGTATQMRWIHARKPEFHRLILWAGKTPEDISYLDLAEYFAQKECWMVHGLQDKFLTEELMNWQREFAKEQKLPLQFMSFDGKHKIDPPTLLKFVT